MKIGPLFLACGIAGLTMAALSNIPVISYGNCLGCMWLWVSGILGAMIYRFSAHTITGGQGAVIGLLSGVVGAILGAILGSIVGGLGFASIVSSVMPSVSPFVSGGTENTILPSLISGGALGTGFALIWLLVTIFLYPLFGAIGGAIGGVIFAKSAPSAQSVQIVQ
jgi:hypothetical protein